MPTERSFKPWSRPLLRRVAHIAEADATDWQTNHPEYDGRWLGSVLVQGSACHFVAPGHGVKDLDVVGLYANPNPPGHRGHGKRTATADFGPSIFGVRPDDARRGYSGRRVDLLVRDLPVAPGTALREALIPWLTTGAARCSGTYLGRGKCECGRQHPSP